MSRTFPFFSRVTPKKKHSRASLLLPKVLPLPTPQVLYIPGSPSTILATTSGFYPFHFYKFPGRSLYSEHVDRLFPIINEIRKGMSPFMQRKTPDSTRSPQQWFRPASNQSVPHLTKSPHPNRALGFSSIKQLARSSHIPFYYYTFYRD